MSRQMGLSRRSLMKSAAGLAGASMVGSNAFAAAPLTVGFIYVGTKTDYGYNQAHAEGAAAVRAMPGVTVVEQSMESHDFARNARREHLPGSPPSAPA